MTTARVTAQAKINLRLRILAREASGYHSIETIFHRVELADDVLVRPTAAGRLIDCVGADVGPAEQNLAYRAAVAYAAATGWPSGFAIEIHKRIPAGGGMGGGSADAGAVLRALDALAPTPVGGPGLRDMGATLGADVPFMTTTDPMALAWGHGERMIGLPALPARVVTAFVPSFSIATADAYRWWDEDSAGKTADAWRKTVDQLADWRAVDRMAVNDFEPVVFARYPELGALVQELRDAGALAMLSGSGSTVIGLPGPDSAALSGVFGEGVRLVFTKTANSVPGVVVSP